MESNETRLTKAAFLEEGAKELVMKEFSLPVLKSGEILVKVDSAPIHTFDATNIEEMSQRENSQFFGYEGSGYVVDSGRGLSGWLYKNKRVAFFMNSPGTWCEHVVVSTDNVIKLNDKLSLEGAACAFTNPIAALGVLDLIKEGNHKSIIISAAASALGKMILRLMKEERVRTIAIVKSQEQRNVCAESGADIILITSDENFEEQLKQQAAVLNATCYIDFVGGKLSAQVFASMPRDSTLYLCGNLSGDKSIEFDSEDMRKYGKTIKEFNSRLWFSKLNAFKRARVIARIEGGLDTSMKTVIAKSYHVSKINEAVEAAFKNRTAGKVIIRFGPDLY